MKRIQDYRKIVGDEVIGDIFRHARKLYGKRIIHVNSTYSGGGVAEMLTSLVPLMNDVGLKTDWRILRGTPDFFDITKKFHNALQGASINLTDMKKNIYKQINEEFAIYADLNYDAVVIHDPQPLPLVQYYRKAQPWLWRCHIDLSKPNAQLWDFLKGFILRYDLAIVTSEDYKKQDLPMEHRIFTPVIDPLSPKNIPLTPKDMQKHIRKYNIPADKPLITQISRFDKWKDPLGVLDVFKRVRKEVDCRLVLCGSMASDDPEGLEIFRKVEQQANNMINSRDVILLTTENNFLVNMLQSLSSVVIQKSLREGFGLTVTEALWKGRPVVASRVGGIPLQIQDGKSGFLVEPRDNSGFARAILKCLKEPEMADAMGQKGREYVRQNFLITRLLLNYMQLLTGMI
ncbi:glycosyltransferase [candidate division KSB1 bacterium]|nr:glycosyltransferase [candidate division KSB1 bacterium]